MFLRHPTLAAAGAMALASLAPAREVAIPTAPVTYQAEPAFGGVKFSQPVQVIFAPGDTNRAFVVERTGCIAVLRDLAKPKREIFLDLSSKLSLGDNDGLLSAVFHPRFSENGFVYVWYSLHVKGRADQLSRFKLSTANPGTLDPASETPLITQATGPHGHDGGHLLFGPDGYLYLSFGDGDERYPEPMVTHQHIDRGFFGSVLRIDVDLKPGSLAPNPHPAVHAGTYAVPPDNPFIGATSFNGANVSPARVRTEFWALGLRNPWRLDFDPATGALWCGDVGLHDREEIDVIVRGGNYGWDYREGTIARPNSWSSPPAAAQLIEPIWDYGHSEGLSITGGFVYHGKKFPELEGKYLFGDFVLGKIWALTPDGAKSVGTDHVAQIGTVPGVVAFTRDPDGEPLMASYSEGKIYRFIAKSGPGAK